MAEQNAELTSIERNPLVVDGWRSTEESEFSTVYSCVIADLTRAGGAISTIARLVHNSLGEPDGFGGIPLGRSAEMSLCEAMLCLGEYVFDKTEVMRETAAMHRKFDRKEEVKNV